MLKIRKSYLLLYYLYLYKMDPFSIASFVVLILLSMFFSGSETALTSIPQHKVDTLSKQHKR